eukprot:TRINITY_DN3011_c0_g1_i2.p1 TRINITY_DN3011_c0_g1~~TRINITY_DN3011_c0_g1_i2.p1  ORF type:complete len:265 (+),score=107.04 TRINITY_DN3011_c0_g1_i2:135-929(+)
MADDEVAKLEARLVEVRGQVERRKREKAAAIERIEELQQERQGEQMMINALGEEERTLTKDVKSMSEKLSEQVLVTEDVQGIYDGLQRTYASLVKSLQDAEEQHKEKEAMEKQIAEISDVLEEEEAERAKLYGSKEQLREQLIAAKRHYKQLLAQRNTEEGVLRSEVLELERELRELTAKRLSESSGGSHDMVSSSPSASSASPSCSSASTSIPIPSDASGDASHSPSSPSSFSSSSPSGSSPSSSPSTAATTRSSPTVAHTPS